MKNLNFILLVFITIFVFSCTNKKLDSTKIKTSLVGCSDNSSYYTSQGYYLGCKKNEVTYIIDDIDLSFKEILDKKVNLKQVNLSKINHELNRDVELQLRTGKTCRCVIDGKSYVVYTNLSGYSCSQLCGLVLDDLNSKNSAIQ